MAATNAIGTGESSWVSVWVPPTVPEAPANVEVIHGNGEVEVRYDAGSDNGAPIRRYTATASPGGATATTLRATCLAGLRSPA